jgi:hypothetical protein
MEARESSFSDRKCRDSIIKRLKFDELYAKTFANLTSIVIDR